MSPQSDKPEELRILFFVEPERDVEMRIILAILVVAGAAFQGGDMAHDVGAGGVHQAAADLSARIGQALGRFRCMRVKKNPRTLAGAGCQHHHTGRHEMRCLGLTIDIFHALCPAPRVHQHARYHRVGDDAQLAGAHRHGKQRGRRLESGADRTTPPAGCRIEASLPWRMGIVDGTRHDRVARRHARDAEVRGRRLDHQFRHARL